jgi:hypothetical protein
VSWSIQELATAIKIYDRPIPVALTADQLLEFSCTFIAAICPCPAFEFGNQVIDFLLVSVSRIPTGIPSLML